MKQSADKLFKTFLVLTIFLIPWQTRWIFYDQLINNQIWEYGRLSLYASTITLILALVFFSFSHYKLFNIQAWQKNRIVQASLILLLYLLIISLLSPLPIVSLYYLILIILTLVFLVLLKHLQRPTILLTLIVSGLVQGGLASWQFWQQQILANKWLGLAEHLPEVAGTSVIELANIRLLRAYGALTHPNVLGGFLVLTILAGLGYWIFIYQQASQDNWRSAKKYLWPLVLTLVSLIISTYGLLASFSRSALLSLGIILFISLLIIIFRKNKLQIIVIVKYIFILLLVGVIFYRSFPEAWNSRWQTTSRLESKSVNERIVSLQQIDFSSPTQFIFGQGLGLNTYLNQQAGTAPYTIQPIHNYFLLALAEVGLLGLILIFNLFIRWYRQTPFKFNQVWILVWLTVGLFDHYFWTSWTGWLILAIILALSPPNKSIN